MINNNPQKQGPFRSPAAWGALVAVAAAFLIGSPAAHAAAAPANTVIGNQATATYLDPNGNSQTATSNIVQTTVQQVGSFTLDSTAPNAAPGPIVNTKTAAAGATVYAPHVLTNTGNGSDTFNIVATNTPASGGTPFAKVEIYNDSNFDGLPDSTTPLCSTTAANGTCTVTPATAVAGNNGQFGFVVAYTLPATASGTATPFATVPVTATAATTALYTGGTTVNVQDSVNLTNVAAFNVSKAIGLPASGVTAPGGGAWPTANNSGKRSSGSSCATSWTAGMTSTAACTYTTYTVTYSNTGGAPGKFAMQDVVGSLATAGLTYVSGSAVWSNRPGTALSETSAAGNLSSPGVDFQNSSGTLTFVDNNLPVNTTRSLTFVVLVNNTATIGTASTTNKVTYNASDAGSANTVNAGAPGTLSASSNGAPFTVLGTYKIVLGSATATLANIANATDTTPGTPNTASADDKQTIASVAAGRPAVFTQVVFNQGNTTDTVNLTKVDVTAFPAGTTFAYYAADGVTPLADTNGDGTVDTGPIAAGSSLRIVVKATIPANTAASTGTPNYTINVVGTSVGDSTQIDASQDVLGAVSGPAVDLTNSQNSTGNDRGTGPSSTPTLTQTVNAGAWTAIPLWVKNNDTSTLAYSLAVSSTTSFPGTMPAGWTVKFATGAVAATGCSAVTAVTTTASIAGNGADAQYTACVFVPTNQVQLTQSVYFQVKSTTAASDGTFPIDTVYDAITVTSAAVTYTATLTPNNNGTVAPGGSGTYGHALTSTGTGTCKVATAAVTLSSGASGAGWTTALYIDTNNDGVLDTSTDQLYVDETTTPIGDVASNTSKKLLVKVFAPAGASAGQAVTATVTITFQAATSPAGATPCANVSANDVVTVVTGQVSLVIYQAKNTAASCAGPDAVLGNLAGTLLTAKPGECLVYRIVATNNGAAPVSNLVVSNTVPAYTKQVTTQPTATCASTGLRNAGNTAAVALSNTDGTGIGTPSSTAVTCGSSTATVPPGATVTLTYQVQIDQ